MSGPGIVLLTVLNDSIKIRVFFGLHQPRLFTMLIDRELRNHRPQPTRQRAAPGVVRKLAGRLSIVANAQAMQFRPDRLRQILGAFFIRTRRTRRGTNRRREAFDQIAPGFLIPLFARDNQTEIVGLKFVDEILDDSSVAFGSSRKTYLPTAALIRGIRISLVNE